MGVRGTDVQVHQVLYEAASAARSEGRLAAALHLHAGVRSRARRTGVPEFIAEALIRTGELQVQLDRLGDAVQSADSARKAAELITNSRVAAWIHADLARLAHSVRSHPGAPNPLSILNVLDSAIATQRGLGHEHLLLNLLVERGRTLASLGREEARADVDAALALVGQVAASSLDSREQARFAEAMRSVGEIAALMTAQGQVSAPWGLSVLEEIASMAWGSPSGPTVSSASPLPLSVPEDRAVVRYAVLEEEAFVWLLVGEDLHRVRLPVPVGELSRLTGELRGAGERGLSLSDLSSPARDLAEQILPPQVMEWVGQRDLVFVPDGPLVGVPFSILPGPDGEMLLRHRAVAVAPSVAWAIAPGRHMPGWGSGAQVVLAGNALPTAGLPSLSGAREEVETLRDRYPDALVLVDSSATPSALQRAIQGADLLHFAGHAVSAPTLTGGSYLVLSPDLPADPESGRFRPTGVSGEGARVVILTACASVAPDGTLTGGGFWGIAQPLLRGGSRSIIGTLWPLPDQEAAAFSELLHQELSTGAGPGVALRAAQLRAMEGGVVPPRTWASFQLVGAGV
jgi:CHAT domain-containing protein